MMEAFWFWLMRPLAEIALALAVAAGAALLVLLASLPRYLKQRRCPHDKVWEDGSCNAHCRACGKNLGFIGTWRDAQKARAQSTPQPADVRADQPLSES